MNIRYLTMQNYEKTSIAFLNFIFNLNIKYETIFFHFMKLERRYGRISYKNANY